jgi:phage recombination protein Bet
VSTNTAIAIRDDQVVFDDNQRKALEHIGVQDASNGDLAVFFHTCKRTGLDPFARQIYMIKRDGKQTMQVGIDGLRLVAQRTTERTGGTLGYEDTQWCGKDGVWRDVWLDDEPPAAARVTILRNGQRYPFIAHYREYVQTYWDKKTQQRAVTKTWAEKPAHMLAKCAEAGAQRKAFPQDLSGLYIGEEGGSVAPAAEPAAGERDSTVITADDIRRARAVDDDIVDGIVDADDIRRARAVDDDIVDGIVDADVVDEPPATETREQAPQSQRDKMFRLFNEFGMSDARAAVGKKERLDYVEKVLGERPSSSAEMTTKQVADVIDALIADLDAAEQAAAADEPAEP